MTEHTPNFPTDLDTIGEKRWLFGLRYELPDSPLDGRDWFNAIGTVDEALHEQQDGSAWVQKDSSLLLFVRNFGKHSESFEKTKIKAGRALALGSLAASILVEVTYVDRDSPIEDGLPPF
jgi:hypothetical protein